VLPLLFAIKPLCFAPGRKRKPLALRAYFVSPVRVKQNHPLWVWSFTERPLAVKTKPLVSRLLVYLGDDYKKRIRKTYLVLFGRTKVAD